MTKKLFAVLLTLCMVLSSAACKSTPKPSETETESRTQQQTQEESTPASTEPAWIPGPEDYSFITDDNGFITGVKASDLIDVPDFSTVSFTKEQYGATEEEVQAEIDKFLSSLADKNEDAAYTVKKGDMLLVDYVGKFGQEAFPGGTASDVEIEAGGVGYIDDFQDQLIGHHPGETFDIEVTFPVPYPNNPDYAGKDATFTITLKAVITTPELTDEFVQAHDLDIATYFMMSDVKTAQELKDRINEDLTEYKINQAVAEYAYSLKLKDYPENVKQVGRKLVEIAFYVSYGIDIKTYQSALGYSDEDMENFIRTEVTPVVFYQAIAEQQGWEITEADYSMVTGKDENEEVIAKYGKGYIARIVIETRALAYIKEHADIH